MLVRLWEGVDIVNTHVFVHSTFVVLVLLVSSTSIVQPVVFAWCMTHGSTSTPKLISKLMQLAKHG